MDWTSGEPIDILLVEDDPNDVELILDVLSVNNLAQRTCVVRDGTDALDFIFCTGAYAGRDIRNTPRLILLDLKLPQVDGTEVLALLKADPRTQDIPVVVFTSSREEQDLVESYGIGVNSYIVKPVRFVEFTSTVQQAVVYWLGINQTAPRDC